MDAKQFSARIAELISSNDIGQAIKEMRMVLANSQKLNEAIIHSAHYNNLKEKIRIGTLSEHEIKSEKSKIMMALLSLADEIVDENKKNPELSMEMKNVFQQEQSSPRIIIQDHKGNGDNVGGDKIIYGK